MEKHSTVLIVVDCLGSEGIESNNCANFLNDLNLDNSYYYPNSFCSGTSTAPNFTSILSGQYSNTAQKEY